jgi:quinoprotein glucose dehydrogenase
MSRWKALSFLSAVLIVIQIGAITAQQSVKTSNPATDWPMFSHDLGGTRFSQLKQITAKNVGTLKLAWSMPYRANRTGAGGGGGVGGVSEATPIVVNGVMYVPAENRVLALDAATGKEIWKFEVMNGPGGGLSRRGVTYWPGEANVPARLFVTAGRRLLAINATTGEAAQGFGTNGEVDIVVPYNSPPTVYKNLLFVGANVGEQPATGPAGNTRAYDARTGAKIWEFHSVPQAGETGNDTWPADGWKDRTGANNWGFYMTVDTERAILYTVFGSPASDYYGFDRKGNNLFGNSVVALDANTGKLKWYFQTVHHDLWDMDLPPAPILMDITVRGRKIPALIQTGKLGLIFILNRVTGEPVFGVEERQVPQSDVPGEFTSATQPFPLKPPMLGKHDYKPEDLVTAADTTEAHAAACRDLVEKSGGTLINRGPYTPWAYRAPGAAPRTAINFPGDIGGTDWGGISADPNTGFVFVNTLNYGSLGWIEKRPDTSRVPYDRASVWGNPVASKFWDRKVNAQGQLLGEQSWPCQKPPWGQFTAINANTGDIAWQVTLGITDELPEGKKNTGRINMGGSIVTAGGVVFIGATNDKRFRAFDAKNGKELWVTKLDNSAIAVPMTYQAKGKQYVAITASGGGGITDPDPTRNESLYVYTLP